MNNLTLLKLNGQYTVFYPAVTGRKRDTVKEVIRQLFGKDTKIFFHDEDVSIFTESSTTTTVAPATVTTVEHQPERVKKESEADRYMKEKGISVPKDIGRVAGW